MRAMNRHLIAAAIFVATSGPALAAPGAFFSLANTNFVKTIGFILFVGVLVYFRVPSLIGGLLDKRAVQIRADLDEARSLREEAQKVLASYERKAREAGEQAERIVSHAREEALLAAEEAKSALAVSLKRRLAAADDQIASAEKSAMREVRDRAVQVAVAAAGDAIAQAMSAAEAGALIEASIKEVDAKLH